MLGMCQKMEFGDRLSFPFFELIKTKNIEYKVITQFCIS